MLKITFQKILSLCIVLGAAATHVAFSQTAGNPSVKKTTKSASLSVGKNEVSKEPKEPALTSEALSFRFSSEHVTPKPGELSWDEHFLNIANWGKSPAGRWEVESKTETATTYGLIVEHRDFMGGRARHVKFRTDPRTGRILEIHVTWANAALSVGFTAPVDVQNMDKREKRKWLKDREKGRKDADANDKKLSDTIEQATEELIANLTKKFGKPEKVDVGESKDFKVEALDFKTPTGTTLRLYLDAGRTNGYCNPGKKYLIASIHPTETLEKGKYAVVPKGKRDGRLELAASNVVKYPNGDVMIKNMPMHDQGDTGTCTGASTAMVIEYYGGRITPTLFSMRQREFTATSQAMNPYYAAMTDAEIKVKTVPASATTIMRELDAGRPLQAGIDTRDERSQLRIMWRDMLREDPKFLLPKESRRERESGTNRWAKPGEGGHSTLLTGYNKEKEIIFMTESSGEGFRNYPISFDEFEATCSDLVTFTPEGKAAPKERKPNRL